MTATDDHLASDLILQVEDVVRHTSYWQAVHKRLQEIREHPDPNLVPCLVKVLMPNPTIPEDDPTMAVVTSKDGGLRITMEARVFHGLVGPRMVIYGVCVWHKDTTKLEWLCEAPGEAW